MVGISNVTDVWIKKCKKHGPHTWWEPFLNTEDRGNSKSKLCLAVGHCTQYFLQKFVLSKAV